jgi:TRAP-type transport system periplasmic protein
MRFVVSCVFAVFLLASSALAVDIKLALDGPQDLKKSGSYVWAHKFATILRANDMAVTEYPRGALGGEDERLDQTRQGLLQVNMAAVRSAGKIDKLIFGLYLPYLFKDTAHQIRALEKAGLTKAINKSLEKGGIRIIAFTRPGPPAGIFNTKRPIRTVADMKGLRMRALDAGQIALYKAWGATGTIVSWREVPNALQTGIAHGYINPAMAPLIFGHTGFIKHFTDAQAIIGGRVVLVSLNWYRALSEQQRQLVTKAAQAATAENLKWLKQAGPAQLERLEKAGITVTRLDKATRADFIARAQTVYTAGVLSAEQLKLWTHAAAATR